MKKTYLIVSCITGIFSFEITGIVYGVIRCFDYWEAFIKHNSVYGVVGFWFVSSISSGALIERPERFKDEWLLRTGIRTIIHTIYKHSFCTVIISTMVIN